MSHVSEFLVPVHTSFPTHTKHSITKISSTLSTGNVPNALATLPRSTAIQRDTATGIILSLYGFDSDFDVVLTIQLNP